MPSTYIALLRGINVGKAKRIAMADLRKLVEKLGATSVQTLLNSGNVVFRLPPAQAPKFAARCEAALLPATGVQARVMLISAAELAAIVAENPLPAATAEPSRFLVAVLTDPKERQRVEPLLAQDWSPDAIAVGKLAIYLWCASGILESKLAVAATKALRDTATTRNWATMTKLLALTR